MTEVEGVFGSEYTVAVVTVAILDDHVIEEAEIFIAILSSSTPNVVIGSGNTSFIVIVDKNGKCMFKLYLQCFYSYTKSCSFLSKPY